MFSDEYTQGHILENYADERQFLAEVREAAAHPETVGLFCVAITMDGEMKLHAQGLVTDDLHNIASDCFETFINNGSTEDGF